MKRVKTVAMIREGHAIRLKRAALASGMPIGVLFGEKLDVITDKQFKALNELEAEETKVRVDMYIDSEQKDRLKDLSRILSVSLSRVCEWVIDA